jgi:phage terminase large subunit-like protein
LRFRSRGHRAIWWIEEYCRVPEGAHGGRPLKLRPWQKKELHRIYDNPAGTRRAILSFGRKNGKTALASFLLLLHLCGPEAKANSQLYSTAQSRAQAAILFELAAKIVRASPELHAVIGIRETAKQLYCPELGTVYRALSAEATTAYGLSPVFIVHDELAQVRGPRSALYEAMETATGAQENPLSIIISTQAATDSDLLSVLIDDALAGHDPRVVVSLYTADPEADPFSVAAIKAANPAYGDFLNAREVRAQARDAERMPAKEAQYRNLILNQRVEASSPFVSAGVWARCKAAPASLEGMPIYGGLDLSSARDLTALVLIGDLDGVWQVLPTFWLPGDGLADKARADRVPYDAWARAGYLETAPGRAIEYEWVAHYLRALFDRLDIRKIGFDSWGWKTLRPWLIKAGFGEYEVDEHFEEFGQGYGSMSPALRALESDLLNGLVAHGDHPVLKMCAVNAVVQSDPAGNRKLAKDKSSGRIDGMVALAMARGVAAAYAEQYHVLGMVG